MLKVRRSSSRCRGEALLVTVSGLGYRRHRLVLRPEAARSMAARSVNTLGPSWLATRWEPTGGSSHRGGDETVVVVGDGTGDELPGGEGSCSR
jgi:hypothetical protein